MGYDLSKLNNRIPKIIGEDNCFKAAVCIALIGSGDGYDVVFEVRSDEIKDQPGDVCLPGGAVNENESYEEAAIRETCEELLAAPEQLKVICAADYIHANNTIIRPFVALLAGYDGTFNSAEVAETFRVPLDFFMQTEPQRHSIDAKITPGEDFPYHLIAGGKDYKWRSRKTEELFYSYEGRVIWGLTARIMHAFAELLKQQLK